MKNHNNFKQSVNKVLKSKTCSLYQWDAFQLVKEIPDYCVDLILTDPPYNLRRGNNGPDRDKEQFDPSRLTKDFQRILKPDGNIFAFCSFRQVGKRLQAFDWIFDTLQYMVRHKTDPKGCQSQTSFTSSCELIICMRNKGHTRNYKWHDLMHNFYQSKKCRGTERIKSKDGKWLHPTQKPLEILKHILEISSNPDWIVFDPFMGLGSTGIASLQTWRRFIGFERDNQYIANAVARIREEI